MKVSKHQKQNRHTAFLSPQRTGADPKISTPVNREFEFDFEFKSSHEILKDPHLYSELRNPLQINQPGVNV